MEKWIRRFVRRMAVKMEFDAEREAVVAYGLIALVQITITLALVLAWGFLVEAPVEALIICLSVSLLRRFSGGAHAHDADFCTLLTTLYCTLTAVLSRALIHFYHPYAMVTAVLVLYAAAFLTVYRYAPVDSPNKPIKSETKIRRMRKASFVTLAVYGFASVLFYILGFPYYWFRAYGISLLFGVGWQAFTLTPLGAILLDKLNVLPKYARKEVSP